MGIESYFRINPIKTVPLQKPWTSKWIKEQHLALKDRAYRRGFRQEAFTEQDRMFPNFYKVKKYNIGLSSIEDNWYRFTGVDISTPIRPGCVIFTLAMSPNGKRHVLDIQRGSWKSPEFAERIIAVNNSLQPTVINVENNGTQQMLIDWALQCNASLPIVGYLTGKQKFDPLKGLPALDIEFQNDAWVIPMEMVQGHEPECLCAWCVFIKEVENYPQYTSDDILMGAFFAREAARKYWGAEFMEITQPTELGIFPL